LKQLAEDHPAVVYKYVKALYQLHKNQQTRPELPQYMETLQSVIGAFAKVFAVVDALDECPDETRTELFEELRSLANINLLVTSRHHAAIARDFQVRWCWWEYRGSVRRWWWKLCVSEVGTGGSLGLYPVKREKGRAGWTNFSVSEVCHARR
jgi:hypothetical protein